MNKLPKVAAQQCGSRGSNSRPLSHQFDALATRLMITGQTANTGSLTGVCAHGNAGGGTAQSRRGTMKNVCAISDPLR